ncbi:hypothetical protein G7Y89_g5909 [Cudoniella acicularis]|uniref:Aminoacyl-transfer RNA synthetases class-II family profile domain-containing protein n=1 Tax=Cudoniella acicularis TaxID=354080 RepID=A0A8H4RNT3_9HELO|nr:hypothetical protein G7Y89_g5909 [Cudoniella acicularis]
MSTPRVFVIRHGETEWSLNGRHTGTTELPLTANGEKRIRATGRALIGDDRLIVPKKLAHIFVSPRKRAQRTLELLSLGCREKLPWEERRAHPDADIRTEAKVEITDDIREWDYGDYEGITSPQIRELRKKQGIGGPEGKWDIWKEGCPGGESPEDVTYRVDRLIATIREKYHKAAIGKSGSEVPPGDVLLVAHGHILRAFAMRWVGKALPDGPIFLLEAGGVGTLSYEHHKLDEPAILLGGSFMVDVAESAEKEGKEEACFNNDRYTKGFNFIMSFGFGIGDFLAVIDLATRIQREFANAPEQFKAISNELESLKVLLNDITDYLPTLTEDNSTEEAEKLNIILASAQAVLKDLDALLVKYGSLETIRGTSRTKRIWQRLRFDSKDVSELRDRITSNVLMLQTFMGRETRMSLTGMSRHIDDQIRQDTLNLISEEDHNIQQNNLAQDCQKESRKWLFESETWNTWINSTGSTLYCPGIPGAGKTYTTAMVVAKLEESAQTDLVAYVFCSYQRRDQENLDQLLLRSLLRMLLEQLYTLPKEICHLYEEYKRTRRDIDFEKILVQMKIVSSQRPRTTLIVDALDELEPQHLKSLITRLLKLQEEAKVNLFFTSRKSNEMDCLFPHVHRVEVTATEEDVRNYLVEYIQQLPPFIQKNKKLQQNICDAIVSGVDGMFLLASLYLSALKDKFTAKTIREALKGFSSGSASDTKVKKAYRNAMNRVRAQGGERVDLAMKTLSILTHARRPLSAIELCHALGVESKSLEFDPDNVPEIEDVLSTCAGLVVHQVETGVVQLVHKSTQDYLKASRAEWFPDAEATMGEICHIYLTAATSSTNVHFHFLGYAKAYWGTHVMAAEKERMKNASAAQPAVPGSLGQALSNNSLREDDIQLDLTRLGLTRLATELGEMAELLVWACENNNQNIAELLLATNVYAEKVEEEPTRQDSAVTEQRIGPLEKALVAAVSFGYKDIVDLLFKNNANLRVRGNGVHSLLALAAREDHPDIVSHLLKLDPYVAESMDYNMDGFQFEVLNTGNSNKDVNDDSKSNCSESSTISSRLPFAIQKTYFSIDRSPSICNEESDEIFLVRSPLAVAAYGRNDHCVKLLLEWMTNCDASDGHLIEANCKNATLCAMAGGHVRIVQGLLPLVGINMALPDRLLDTTLLHLASRWGDDKLVELLLGEDTVVVSIPDKIGRTPLIWAARNRNGKFMYLLLGRKDVQPNLTDNIGRTALIWAFENEEVDMIRMLLGRDDVNVNMRDSNGCTLLSRASKNGKTDITRMLLERDDIQPDLQDNSGRTPLSWASQYGHINIVQILLARDDVLPDSRDSQETTPAEYAFEMKHQEVFRLLISRAPTVLSQKKAKNCTLIHRLIRNDHKMETGDYFVDRTTWRHGCYGLRYEVRASELLPGICDIPSVSVDHIRSSDCACGVETLLMAVSTEQAATVKLLLDFDPAWMHTTKHVKGRTPLDLAMTILEEEREPKNRKFRQDRLIFDIGDELVEMVLNSDEEFSFKFLLEMVETKKLKGPLITGGGYASLFFCLSVIRNPSFPEEFFESCPELIQHLANLDELPEIIGTQVSDAHLVAILLDRLGVNPNQQDARGRTVLSYRAERVRSHEDDISSLLIDKYGANPFLQDGSGKSPIMYAYSMAGECLDCFLGYLSSKDLPLDEVDHCGRNLFMLAVIWGSRKTVGALLRRQPLDIGLNRLDNLGRVPLTLAINHNFRDRIGVVDLLLSHPDISVDVPDNEGRTPFRHAIDNTQWELRKYTSAERVNGKAVGEPNIRAERHIDLVERMTEFPAVDLDRADNYGETLRTAVKRLLDELYEIQRILSPTAFVARIGASYLCLDRLLKVETAFVRHEHSSSSSGILESKPLPPSPKSSRPELPKAKRPLGDPLSTVSSLGPANVISNSKLIIEAKNQTTHIDTHKFVETVDTLPVQTAIIPHIDRPNSPDNDFPQTETEARDHITAIRNRKIEKSSADLEHALDLLSNSLYQNTLHFLLELLQNADDNSYKPRTTPSMTITYEGGRHATLRFDTNEIGFRMADVEAICGIGNSSKKEPLRIAKLRRIGEKGIGFKSVFGVSDEVFISSGHYSFMFNNGKPSGRLAPMWAQFPRDRLTGFTSMYLRLRPGLDKTMLVEALQNLDGRHLMFLRQLKKVDIFLLNTGNNKKSVIRLQRREVVCKLTSLPARMVEPDNFPPYALFRYPVSDLPPDDARKHQTESELILAFPTNTVSDNSTSEPKKHGPDTHNVYAFLPVRDYGFKIIIQADFILVANREDIDSGSEWNRGLLKNIPKALLAAINYFNTGPFRFSWLRYLPLRQETHDFFQDLWPNTQEVLSRERILESAKGDATVPSALRYVPKELADKRKRSLIPVSRSKFNHVSHHYPSEASEALESLGVKRLSAEDFLDDLSEFIATYPNDFQHMPNEWHSQLSNILDSLTPKHEQLISSLPIIPLRDGKWVSPCTRNLLFPLQANGLIIPDNLNASVIHEDAANDPSRKSLLRKFQVQDAKESEVCRIILETHESEEFEYKAVSIAALISHATFLYKSGHKVKGSDDTLWIVASDGSRYPSRQVYMERLNPDPVVQILSKHNNQFHFLHRDYYLSFSRDEDRDWLVEVLGVAMSPRLVHSQGHKAKSFAMHDDFRFLINASSAQDVLQILKICWIEYRPRIAAEKVKRLDSQTHEAQSEDETEEASRRKIRATFSAMTVQCCDGSFSSLEHTYLPRRSVLLGLDITSPESHHQETESEFPLLCVPDPDAGEWDFLENFSVVVEVKAKHLISRLQELKNTVVTKEQVLPLYERLQAFTDDEDVGLIKRRFKEEHLVFIPESTGESSLKPRWVSTDDCVWDTLPCLRRIPCLIEYYHDCKVLFCATIGLGPATYKTVIAEAKQIGPTDSLDYIGGVFKQLSHLSSGMSCDTEVSELQAFPVFPVSTGDAGSSFQFLKPAGELSKSNSWYIPDKKFLRESFVGKAPLLAFDDLTVGQIGTLINTLGCENRRLSKLAIRHAKIEGWNALNEEYTCALQTKWKYIARLIPAENPRRITTARQLRDICVYQVQRIRVSWQFITPWKTTISGPSEKGRVKLVIVDNMLKIYLTEKDDMKISCPPPQLVTEISQFCGITNMEHNIILHGIFIRQDERRIEDNLKEHDIPDEIPEFPKNILLTTDRDELKANDSAEDEVDDFVELLPSSGGDPSPEPTSHPSYETRWGRVPSNTKTTEQPSENNTGSWGRTFLPPLVPTMGGGANYDTDIEQRMFKAELFVGSNEYYLVSSFLGEIMGCEYKEKIHWTSYLRGRAKHKAFDERDSSISTFTIQDTSGYLTQYFVKQGHIKVEYLKKTATFYIQVSFSPGAVNSTFTLGTEQVKKAKKISCTKGADNNIFILALVFNLDVNPIAAMVVDPWKLHHDGSLSLEAYSKYRASFQEGTEVFYVGKTNTGLDNVSNLKYRGLKAGEIRLLELSPGEGDVPLNGTIHQVPISSPGSFWAISYVWGAPKTPDCPDCPSLETPDGRTLLTQSLDTVLRRLRETKVSILLWADAICINQDDKTEKGLQVRLMGDIFHKALRVVAWIGREFGDGDHALESLKSIPLPVATSRSTPVNMGGTESTTLYSGNISTWNDRMWAQIDQLMNRDWFRRAWITQELVLASDVVIMCGRSELDWDHFFKAVTICEKWFNSQNPETIRLFNYAGPVYSLGGVRRRLRDEDKKHSLLELLELFAHTQATIKCDKLFALLGLAYDSDDDGFNPDYDSTLEEIVWRYASVFVRRGDAMELLYRSGLSNPKAYEFCSWIPNWTGDNSPQTELPPTNFPQTISTWDASGGIFYAGKEAAPTAKIGIPPTLEVTGYEIDTIRITHNVRMGPGRPLDCMTDFRNHIKHLTRYPTGETSNDILLWLPIGKAKRPHLESENDRLSSYRQFLSREIKDWPDNFREVILSISPEMSREKYNKMPHESRVILSNYWKTAAAFSNRLSNAVLCFTKKGYVGLCPGDTVVDDEICLLHGGRVPFVIRKRDREAYTLVGECYIHGLMHGEAIKMNSNLIERRFQLV